MSKIIVPNYISKMLKDVGIEQNISECGLKNNIPISFSATIPTKGNKNKIEALISTGWCRGLTSKQRTDDRSYRRNQYDGYIMVTTLTWYVNDN